MIYLDKEVTMIFEISYTSYFYDDNMNVENHLDCIATKTIKSNVIPFEGSKIKIYPFVDIQAEVSYDYDEDTYKVVNYFSYDMKARRTYSEAFHLFDTAMKNGWQIQDNSQHYEKNRKF